MFLGALCSWCSGWLDGCRQLKMGYRRRRPEHLASWVGAVYSGHDFSGRCGMVLLHLVALSASERWCALWQSAAVPFCRRPTFTLPEFTCLDLFDRPTCFSSGVQRPGIVVFVQLWECVGAGATSRHCRMLSQGCLQVQVLGYLCLPDRTCFSPNSYAGCCAWRGHSVNLPHLQEQHW